MKSDSLCLENLFIIKIWNISFQKKKKNLWHKNYAAHFLHIASSCKMGILFSKKIKYGNNSNFFAPFNLGRTIYFQVMYLLFFCDLVALTYHFSDMNFLIACQHEFGKFLSNKCSFCCRGKFCIPARVKNRDMKA